MNEPLSVAEYLKTHDTLTYTNVGVSMLPLLRQGKDLFTVNRKGPERCQKGDVVLYRRGSQYVLHRVVEARPEDYVILGDNCIAKEYGVTDADIIAVMSGYVRDGKAHSVRDGDYRLYSWFILHTVGPRIFLKRCRTAAARFVRRGRHES